MSSYAGSAAPAVQSWSKKRHAATLLDRTLAQAKQIAVPLAVAGWLWKRYQQHRRKQPKKTVAAAAQATAAPVAAARHARRNYKVKRDELDGPTLYTGDVEVQPHDNVMEVYQEDEVEAAAAADAAGGGAGGRGNEGMLQMLQQMGYRVIMPKDGKGQVFLVPPGQAGPGEDAIAEGDEEYDEGEGYDEDEA